MSERETVHASTVAIEHGGVWHAVLLAGRSGAGKSDLALRLVDRGARLVADDYTDLRRDGDRLFAAPPARIAGKIEVRGIGIADLPYLAEAPVALVIALDEPVERMPARRVRTIAGSDIPLFALAAFEASAPLKVEAMLRQVLADPTEPSA